MKEFDMLRARLHESEIRRAIGAPGEGDLVVDGVAPLGAEEDRCLYFVNREVDERVVQSLAARKECIVIARPRGFASELPGCRLLEVGQPRLAIARVLGFIKAEGRQLPWVAARRIAPNAVISPLSIVDGNVEIGEGVIVEPFCTIGPDVVIGRGSLIRSGARILPRVSIGDQSIIGANAVIGSEGFGFVRDEADTKTRIPHLGGVVVGSHVEIGAVSVIQSGTISPTVIEDHVKIDDNVEVAHNAHVGRGASVTGGVVLGGSVVIGSDAWIGINAAIRDGRRVGSRTLVGMNASIQHDVADNSVARAPSPEIRPGLGKKLTP